MKKDDHLKRYRPEFIRVVEELRRNQTDVDRLPYTPLFDELYEDFASKCDVPISQSDFFWQLVVVRKNFKRLSEQLAAG